MGEWKEYKLNDLAEIHNNKRKPLNSLEREKRKGIYPYYGASGIIDFIDDHLFDGEYVLISEDGENLSSRQTPIAFKVSGKFWVNNHAHIIKGKEEHLNSLLVLYFACLDLMPYITGAVQPKLSKENLLSIPIYLPESKEEQKSIASVLSSLDDKIDLLHRQNKTLEALAETLFRQWYIEAAPQPSPNLSQGERNKEEGWETKKVKDVCMTITKGTTPTTIGKQFKEQGINFIKAESLTDDGGFLPEKFAFIDKETDELLSRSRIQCGDVLITIAGTIGRIAHVTQDILPANTNQAIGIMRANKKIINSYFIYCLFKTSEIRNDFEGRIVHAVQPNLSLGEISDIEFKMPPDEKLKVGMCELTRLFNKKENNTIQIRTLTRLRDTLLPKLMSGEVRVKDA